MLHANTNEARFPIHRARPLILAPILAIAALALDASAQQTVGPRPAELVAHDATQSALAWADAGYQSFLAKTPGPWRPLYDEDWGRPISIVGKGIPTTTGPIATTAQARSVAEAVLAQYPELWRVPVSQLRLANETQAGRLFVFTWQQEFDGLEVRRARVRIQVHEAGRVASISATTTPIPRGFSRDAKITAEGARAIVALGKELLASDSVLTSDLLVFVDAKGGICVPRLAWQVSVEQPSRQVHERVFVDANDGRILLVEPTQLDFAPQQVQGNVTAPAKNALDPVSTATVPLGGARHDPKPKFPVPDGSDVHGREWQLFRHAHPEQQLERHRGSRGPGLPGEAGPRDSLLQDPELQRAVRQREPDSELRRSRHRSIHSRLSLRANPRLRGGEDRRLRRSLGDHTWCQLYLRVQCLRGKSQLSFTLKIGGCTDTTYSTVVYHEYGHAVDDTYGGMLDGALSEALGDIFAMYKTGQPVLGQDFFGPGTQVRNGVNGVTWPALGCGGESHCMGRHSWDSRGSRGRT